MKILAVIAYFILTALAIVDIIFILYHLLFQLFFQMIFIYLALLVAIIFAYKYIHNTMEEKDEK